MSTFFNAVSSVAIIFLLTAVGYYCAARRWMGPEVKAFISRYLMRLAIPFMCTHSLVKNLSRELVFSSAKLLLLCVLGTAISLGFAFLMGKLLSNNLINLGLYEEVRQVLAEAGKSLSDMEEQEPEPGRSLQK